MLKSLSWFEAKTFPSEDLDWIRDYVLRQSKKHPRIVAVLGSSIGIWDWARYWSDTVIHTLLPYICLSGGGCSYLRSSGV